LLRCRAASVRPDAAAASVAASGVASVTVRRDGEFATCYLDYEALAGRSFVGTAHDPSIGPATHDGITAIEGGLWSESGQRGEVALQPAPGQGQARIGERAQPFGQPPILVAALCERTLNRPGGAVEQVACPLPSLSQLCGGSEPI